MKTTDSMGLIETYTYDIAGNQISKVGRSDKTTKNTYNSINILTQVNIEDVNGTAEEFIKYKLISLTYEYECTKWKGQPL